jgi:hypothetical protein
MRFISRIISVVILVTMAAGCAIGPSYSKVSSTFPQPAPGTGRIYFYRDHSPFGSAVITPVTLNGEHVGNSQPGGFFYVDRPVGSYVVSCSTEVTHQVSLELGGGDSR